MNHQPPPRRHTDCGSVIWEYTGGHHARPIAEQAEPGNLVYAPPDPVIAGHRAHARNMEGRSVDLPPRPAPPDLQPLRDALAARGYALESAGPFYWRIITLAGRAFVPSGSLVRRAAGRLSSKES